MVTSRATCGEASTPASAREVRKLGWRLAALISTSWLLTSLAGALLGQWLAIEVAAALWFVAIGSLPAIPVAALLGRAFSQDAVARKGVVLKMAVLAVLIDALVIAVVVGFAISVVGAAPQFRDGQLDAVMTGIALFGMYAIIAFVFGVVVYGLPGLAIAGISAFIWSRWMRMKFGEEPGNGDTPLLSLTNARTQDIP